MARTRTPHGVAPWAPLAGQPTRPVDYTGRIVAAPQGPSWAEEPATVCDLADNAAALVDRRWASRERQKRLAERRRMW